VQNIALNVALVFSLLTTTTENRVVVAATQSKTSERFTLLQ
jgi:hypothetical protein